ncbi:MAG: zinc ribbon domain-containing protein [Acidobacteriales bacterium]|nr:zinc ribbon domain-containing protein [Terriglobales bacterium]
MPLYEYQCKKCGHRFERIQKFSDAPVKKCPECGGAVERLISPPAVQFKGTGWYVTDYARKGSSRSSDGGGATESSESTEKAAKPETDKGETKPKSEQKKLPKK